MSNQPSTRKDGFGTEGIGEDETDIGSHGHSSQGGTAAQHNGGSGSESGRTPSKNPANKQDMEHFGE